jgi:hypothetical protein
LIGFPIAGKAARGKPIEMKTSPLIPVNFGHNRGELWVHNFLCCCPLHPSVQSETGVTACGLEIGEVDRFSYEKGPKSVEMAQNPPVFSSRRVDSIGLKN